MTEIESWSKFELEDRIARVQKCYRSMETQTQNILCENESTDVKREEANEILEKAYSLSVKLADKMKMQLLGLQKSENQSVEVPKPSDRGEDGNAASKVPSVIIKPSEKVQIRKFSGEQCEWYGFLVWLEENVSNNNHLSGDEKFEIIKKATSGSAVELYLDEASNYELALAALKKSFDTTFKVTQQAFRQLKRMTLNRALPVSEAIWSLIKETDSLLSVFTSRAVEGMDYIVMLIVLDKLDETNRTNWDRYLRGVSESQALSTGVEATEFLPKWQHLREFLKEEAKFQLQTGKHQASKASNANSDMAKSASENTQSPDDAACLSWPNSNKAYKPQSGATKPAVSAPNTSDYALAAPAKSEKPFGMGCFVCGKDHMVKQCREFLEKNIEKREEKAYELQLCLRCLRSVHNGRCKDDTCNNSCPKCGPADFHNNLLCPNAYTK